MAIGRPKEFDTDRALEAAMQLFWHKGYEATSLQDLLKTMHLSKSSFYQTFASKHEIFELCINLYRDSMVHYMEQSLVESSSGLQFIESVFYGIEQETKKSEDRRGCFIMNSASEFSQSDPVIADLVAKGTNKITNVFTKAVRQAQREGDIDKAKKPESIAKYLVSNMSGIKTMVKAGIKNNEVKEIVDVMLMAF